MTDYNKLLLKIIIFIPKEYGATYDIEA